MDHLPEVLSHDLARMDMRKFVNVLQSHRDRLLPVFKAEEIESIIQKFSPQFKYAVVGESDTSKSF